ncbi:MAG: chromosome segregation protein SMC [Actinomycetia bacterium]|nr:chromosome segregation protein SMC [Actinomycetes bacterium]
MYLKSLTLKGFKSFADKSLLVTEPGITCIVGPNGSGKSNISDAVLWVLGEQSAKTLRGQAMEDVIFAGSSARAAVGVAEVDLVLDNSDGTLPLEFGEVTITRRMYRSGESEYLINQSPTRLLDIVDLLHDTGLGRDAHSIISQGHLAEVLEARPETRRALIEEAAGTLKHKRRKERALRRLTGLDEKLQRAADIAKEIDRQLRPLERQASKTAKHRELSEELRDLEVALAVDELRSLQADWDALLKEEKESEAALEIARYKLGERERELDKYQHLLEEKGLFVGDLGEQRRRMQSILERLDASMLLLEEKGKNLISRLSELRMNLSHAQTQVQVARGNHATLERERTEADAQLQELYSQLGELRREGEAARKARVAADETFSRLANDMRTRQAKSDEARVKKIKLEQELASLTTQRDLLSGRTEALALELAQLHETLSSRRSQAEVIETDYRRFKREISAAELDVNKRVRVNESRRKELESIRNDLFAARGEQGALEEMERALISATPALEQVLSRAGEIDGFIASVSSVITTEPAFEALVERVLGSDLFGVFVRDRAAATKLAAETAGNERGELAIIPLDGQAPELPEAPPCGSWLLEHLSYDERFAPALRALIGDVVFVKDLKEAAKLLTAASAKLRAVTPEGIVLWPSGKVSLGRPVADNEGVLARARRINELRDLQARLEADLGEREAELALAEEALNSAQTDALELNQRAANLIGQRDSLLQELGRIEDQTTKLESERTTLEDRLREVASGLQTQAPAAEAVESEINALVEEIASLRTQTKSSELDRDTKFRNETAATDKLSACQVEIATVGERVKHLTARFITATEEVARLNETIKQTASLERALELLRERVEPLHSAFSALQERADYWAIMLRDRASLEQSDSASLRTTIHDAQTQMREAQSALHGDEQILSELRVRKGQLEITVNTAVAKIVDQYAMPLEAALELPPVEDRYQAQDRALTLQRKISHLGSINPIAHEQYENLKARGEFMAEQVADLDAARKALTKVVITIDRKMRERFLETFEQVDKHFQAIFALLFPGGSAQLLLSAPEDLDNTGVDFVVQPRGKKLKKMSLLSGGEQALVAIALLFALNETRPSPFYVLDEVEAALDDSNLRRFVNFVIARRHQTQFLIVTHQRRTMEIADLLYGVSMQADGVSKLVSQKLEQAVEALDHEEK